MKTIDGITMKNASIDSFGGTIAAELSALITGDQMRYFENVARIGSTNDLAAAEKKFASLDDELKTGIIAVLEKVVSRNSTALLKIALRDESELVAAAADASFEVRSCAAIALGAIGGNEAVKALVKMLSDDNTKAAAWAKAALVRIGKPAAAELTAAMFDCADESRGKIISDILGKILEVKDWNAEIEDLKNTYGKGTLDMLVNEIKNKELVAGVENGEGPIKVNFLDGLEAPGDEEEDYSS